VAIISCALNLGWAGAFWALDGGVLFACEIYHKLLSGATMELLEDLGRCDKMVGVQFCCHVRLRVLP
jgi:hypothetical protein